MRSVVLGVVNRILLALVGLVLLGGALVLALGPAPFGSGRHRPLLDAAHRDRLLPDGLPWWVPALGLGLVVLLALWWLLGQLRRDRPAAVVVDTGDGGGARLRATALEAAVRAEVLALDGIDGCRVSLRGRRRRSAPGLRVVLRLEPDAAPDAALAAVAGPVLEHARAVTGLPGLTAHLRLRVTAPGSGRVT
ncbi:alkaline shock response membrane anchor protein AmaP [Streptomyces sp. BI20]|uniref:alkaline shock response membrane anchor protein AmaP n=1 Tax=Streptomyces sp. BI20 TaxID=3403460 RepID=UPI003C75C096